MKVTVGQMPTSGQRREILSENLNKSVIVVDEALPIGLMVNTASVLALTLGHRVEGLIGPDLKDGSGDTHVGITTLPVPILKADSRKISFIRNEAASSDAVLVVDFTDVAQSTKTYDDYAALLESRAADQLRYLGVALYGDKRVINRLTGSLPLLR